MTGSKRYKISPYVDSVSATSIQLFDAKSINYSRMLQVTREMIHGDYHPTHDQDFVYITGYMPGEMLSRVALEVANRLKVPIKVSMTSVDDAVEPSSTRRK